MRRAGDALAEQFTNVPAATVSRRLGSVVSASGGKATVMLDGDDEPTAGVPMLASCSGASAGDRAVVDTYLGMSVVVGVLAGEASGGLVEVGNNASAASVFCDPAYDQRVMTLVEGSEGRYMTVAADGYFGLYANDSQSWVWRQTMPYSYSLPAASASTRGGVRVGDGLKVSGDVLSVDNGAYVKALWAGSSSGSVTLSESVAGYRAIVVSIGGTDGVVEGTTLVWSPNGKTFDVSATLVVEHASNPWRAIRMRFTASGASLSCSVNLQYNSAGDVATGQARLLSVVGIR